MLPKNPLYKPALKFWSILPAYLRALGYWAGSAKFAVGVLGLVLDDNGRLILGHQPYKRPNDWSLLGGSVRSNEKLECALQREIYEESGLLVNVGEIVYINECWPKNLDMFFLCQLMGGTFRTNAETDALISVDYPFDSIPVSFEPMHSPAIAALRSRLLKERSREYVFN